MYVPNTRFQASHQVQQKAIIRTLKCPWHVIAIFIQLYAAPFESQIVIGTVFFILHIKSTEVETYHLCAFGKEWRHYLHCAKHRVGVVLAVIGY